MQDIVVGQALIESDSRGLIGVLDNSNGIPYYLVFTILYAFCLVDYFVWGISGVPQPWQASSSLLVLSYPSIFTMIDHFSVLNSNRCESILHTH